jgi:hypothetical protein
MKLTCSILLLAAAISCTAQAPTPAPQATPSNTPRFVFPGLNEVKVEFEINEVSEEIIIGYKDLVEMYKFVADVVFPAFAGFFPQTVIPGKTPKNIVF